MALYIANIDNGNYNLVVQAENTAVATKKIDTYFLEEHEYFPKSIRLTEADSKYVIGSEKYEKMRSRAKEGKE